MRTLIKTLVLGVALTFAAPLAFGQGTPDTPKKAKKVKATKKATKKKVTKKATKKKVTKRATKKVKKAKGE